MTFFPDRLQFISQDVTLRIPLDRVLGLDSAGARETFLKVRVDPKSKFATTYQSYLSIFDTGTFHFVLDPQEPIAPAFHLAEDYAHYADSVRSGQEQAIVSGEAPAPAGITGATAAASSAGEKRELARYDAGFLERHNPSNKLLNGFKAINGIPGTLIVFDTGLGYVSTTQNPSLKPTRQQFEQSGYLKFFVPQSAILGMHDVSVIRNGNALAANTNSFIAEVDLDRNSSFYQQTKALMAESDQDNRLFFAFKERYLLNQFLANAPHGSGARDSF